MNIKLRPSATVVIETFDLSGTLLSKQTTRNSLLSSFMRGVGKGVFSPKFTLRLGSDGRPTNYYDDYIYSPVKFLNADEDSWFSATATTTWPVSTVNNAREIVWSTTQVFEIPADTVIGTIRELGFNFYGDKSPTINARALLPEPLTIQSGTIVFIRYNLTFRAQFDDVNYVVNSVNSGVTVTHTVTQRWSKNCTLKELLFDTIPDKNCSLYWGTLQAFGVDPTGFIGTSSDADIELLDDTTISIVSSIDPTVYDGENPGISCVKFDLIPIKLSFNPPIPKTSNTRMALRLNWDLK